MIQFLRKWAKPIIIIPFFLLTCLFIFFLFPKYGNELNKIAGEEVQILDKYPVYTKAQVRELFTKIKAEGRAVHYFISSKIDMVFPLVYGIFLILLISFLLHKVFNNTSTWILIGTCVCLFLMLVDYLENFTTLQLLSSFPDLDDALIIRGSILANLKIILIVLASGFVIFPILGWIISFLWAMTTNRSR